MENSYSLTLCPELLYGGSSGVQAFAKKNKQDALMQAFVYPALKAFLEAEAPGKKVLDIGCGSGDWLLSVVPKVLMGLTYKKKWLS